jgi:hypothetical protein
MDDRRVAATQFIFLTSAKQKSAREMTEAKDKKKRFYSLFSFD